MKVSNSELAFANPMPERNNAFEPMSKRSFEKGFSVANSGAECDSISASTGADRKEVHSSLASDEANGAAASSEDGGGRSSNDGSERYDPK